MHDKKAIHSALLRALKAIGTPAGAAVLADYLQAEGLSIPHRTIRQHLQQLDQDGLTETVSRRRGRRLTDRGLQEIEQGNVIDKLGFIATRIDQLGFQMSFNLQSGKGTIIANTAVLPQHYLVRAVEEMKPVFAAKIGMGDRILIAHAGERIGSLEVPRKHAAIATVCSVTVNGILLNSGIPTISRFGGLLEMRDYRPQPFVELIEYSGTTIDPLDVFIEAGRTSVRACGRTGKGFIGASFREIPSPALPLVQNLRKEMNLLGLRGILAVGRANQPLMGIPVSEGRAGMIVIAGINPVAALIESGARIQIESLAQLIDYRLFTPLHEWRRKYAG